MADHIGLYLVLVVAIGLGFFLGRRSRARRRGRHINDLGRDYFQGINHLLDDRPDLAIDSFVSALAVNDASIETHFALGALVRRRGDLEQAIRIHQNLLSRPQLSAENRVLTELELARDYLGGGLLDRAEELLLEIARRGGATERVALEHLLQVYQRERDWPRAIEIGMRIGRRGDRESRTALAHFHCEVADLALRQKDLVGARRALEQARRHDRSCPRIGLQLAQVELDDGRPQEALDALRDVATGEPGLVGQTLELVRSACAALGKPDEVIGYLERNVAWRGDALVAAELAMSYQRLGESKLAADLLAVQLSDHPSIAGLHALLAFDVERGTGIADDHATAMLRFAQRELARRPLYRCGNCGFAGRLLLWQCPSCHQWGRINRIVDS